VAVTLTPCSRARGGHRSPVTDVFSPRLGGQRFTQRCPVPAGKAGGERMWEWSPGDVAELPMQLVLAGGRRPSPIFRVSDSPCWEIHLRSRGTTKSGSFCDLADGDEGCPRPWRRTRLVLRQPVMSHCHPSPRGAEGRGDTTPVAEQVWAGCGSRAGPSLLRAEARGHAAPLQSRE